MAVEIDGVLKEWGDRLYYVRTKARPAPRSITGFRLKAAPEKPASSTAGIMRATLRRTAKRTPEVMVKITSGRIDQATGKRGVPCKDMRGIKAHMDYISRNGAVPLENERGNQIEDRDAVRELRDEWQYGGAKAIPTDGGYRREAFNIVLSMPPGTDRQAVKEAARDFAKANFAGHQYIFAAHDDEAHPHVHLCVKAVSRGLVRLNPRKADLQQWRESFAEKLREHGVEANATARAPRGRTHRPELQAVRHLDRAFDAGKRGAPSRARAGRQKAVLDEVAGVATYRHPAETKLVAQRQEVVNGYGQIAKALASSRDTEDQRLALEIVDLVRGMAPPKSLHRLAIESREQGPAGGVDQAVERRDRDRDR